MRIGIFGMGYVGLTTAACLLRKGIPVVGYEVSDVKRAELAAGRCPLTEPGVEPLLQSGLKNGTFRVSADLDASELPDIILVCVGTPSAEDGSTDLTAVRGVFLRLTQVIGASSSCLVDVALRSTVPPGSLDQLRREFPSLFEHACVVFYPEFLREGTAMSDFETPPQTVFGVTQGSRRPERLLALAERFGFSVDLVSPVSAEALKMASNAYHALKVCFANEIGRIVTAVGGDATEVMRLFVRDTVLNVSARYLMPGAPYGGSCLPKDVRSISSVASRARVPAEILSQCEVSNSSHMQYIVSEVLRMSPRRVAMLGLAFKPNTDDLRESPSLGLSSALLATGIQVVAHDFAIVPERLTGVNRAALAGLLKRPGMSLATSPDEAVAGADALILMHRDRRYDSFVGSASGRHVIDVAGWRFPSFARR